MQLSRKYQTFTDYVDTENSRFCVTKIWNTDTNKMYSQDHVGYILTQDQKIYFTTNHETNADNGQRIQELKFDSFIVNHKLHLDCVFVEWEGPNPYEGFPHDLDELINHPNIHNLLERRDKIIDEMYGKVDTRSLLFDLHADHEEAYGSYLVDFIGSQRQENRYYVTMVNIIIEIACYR